MAKLTKKPVTIATKSTPKELTYRVAINAALGWNDEVKAAKKSIEESMFIEQNDREKLQGYIADAFDELVDEVVEFGQLMTEGDAEYRMKGRPAQLEKCEARDFRYLKDKVARNVKAAKMLVKAIDTLAY